MECNVISKEQAKRTVVGKTRKNSLRNVLNTPFIEYSPIPSEYIHKQVTQTLVQCLEKIAVEEKHKKKQVKGVMFIGVNEVSKALSRNSVHSVLLANDTDTRMLVQCVMKNVMLHNVPCLMINNLKDTMEKLVGFKTVALGLKREACRQDGSLRALHRLIKQEAGLFATTGALVSKNQHTSVEEDSKIEESVSGTPVQYLYRKSKDRIFIPAGKQITTNLSSEDFFKLPDTEDESESEKITYLPVRVKRVKSDVSKVGRKKLKCK